MSVILSKSMQTAKEKGIKKWQTKQKAKFEKMLNGGISRALSGNSPKKRNRKALKRLFQKPAPKFKKQNNALNSPKSVQKKQRKTAFGRTEIQKLTKSKIKKDLDIIFSTWRRMVNADDEGNLKCCSCNTPRHWTELTNGYYISRAQAPGLIFNEMNTGAQCKRCNGFLEGNATGYRENLIKLHGINKVEWLESVKYLKSGNGVFEFKILLLEYIAKFKKQCARLNYTPNVTEQRVLKRWAV